MSVFYLGQSQLSNEENLRASSADSDVTVKLVSSLSTLERRTKTRTLLGTEDCRSTALYIEGGHQGTIPYLRLSASYWEIHSLSDGCFSVVARERLIIVGMHI